MSKQLSIDSLLEWLPVHYLHQPSSNYKTGQDLIDGKQLSLWAFVAMVAFNPIFWNIVARNEFRNKTITRIVGSPLIGCYLLALTIFSLSAIRDHLFLEALKGQPSLAIMDHSAFKILAIILFAFGQIFVVSSMWMLGVTGTYLGDYFGILMSHRVTGFPFNVLNDPMYIGSFLTHVGTAFWLQSPMGVLLSLWVLFVYLVALRYEGPFTDNIYLSQSKKNDGASEETDGSGSSTSPSILANSTAVRSAPMTPSRKSSRLIRKSDAGSDSDASAPPLSSITPRRSARTPRATPFRDESSASSPARITRSRSRALGSDAE